MTLHVAPCPSNLKMLENSYETSVIIPLRQDIPGYIQKFPDWPPGMRTANGKAVCH